MAKFQRELELTRFLRHHSKSMTSNERKPPTMTWLWLLVFLITVLLISTYETAYEIAATQSLQFLGWNSLNSKEISAGEGTETINYTLLRRFYDQAIRKGIGRMGGPKMNIFLMSAFEHPDHIYVMMASFNKYGNTIYCRYFDQQRSEIVPPFKTVVFPEFTALCLRREGVKHISLSDAPTGYYEYPVSITDRTQNVTTHYFSACLAPLYGMEPKWLLLAEFIEHHKIQGVTHFYIYVNELDEYSWILLDNYVRSGEAEVIAFLDYFSRDDRLSQLLQLQECLTRSRGHSQWVAMVDLDERLTPTEYRGTLSDFLQTIFNQTIAELSFRQQFILRNETLPQKYISKSQVAKLMPTWRYHNTSQVLPPGNISKYIVDPKKVIIANVHAVDLFLNGYGRYYMKPEEAVVRHYRDVHRGNWKERWLSDVEEFGEFSITDYPAKHMNTLRENVQQRLHSAYVGMH
ncbi:hypothetical protein Angca_000636 [Angiostrongylus cantonensis]|nr:hypothetical protein Angca_000636 [Angiostrongylus cantonensis]